MSKSIITVHVHPLLVLGRFPKEVKHRQAPAAKSSPLAGARSPSPGGGAPHQPPRRRRRTQRPTRPCASLVCGRAPFSPSNIAAYIHTGRRLRARGACQSQHAPCVAFKFWWWPPLALYNRQLSRSISQAGRLRSIPADGPCAGPRGHRPAAGARRRRRAPNMVRRTCRGAFSGPRLSCGR